MKGSGRFGLSLALGALVAAGAWGLPEWRLSNPLGDDLGPAAQAKASKGWVLRIETDATTETRSLLENGVEDSVRLVDRGPDGRVFRIRDLRAGRLQWAVTYDPVTALPSTETSYLDDQPEEVATLEFRSGVLFRRTVRDGSGTLLYTDTLGHWPDGTLRRLERDGPDGPLAEAAWSYGTGRVLSGSWSADGPSRAEGEHRSWAYSASRTEESLVKGTEVLETRVTDWLEAGASRQTRTIGTRTEVVSKDAQGRITESVVKDKDLVVQTRRWTFDDRGRVVESSIESAGPREVWTYTYQSDGTVVARLSRGEVLVQEERSRDGEKFEVRYFDRDEVFLVETWSGGKRTKEAYYQQGALVRERMP